MDKLFLLRIQYSPPALLGFTTPLESKQYQLLQMFFICSSSVFWAILLLGIYLCFVRVPLKMWFLVNAVLYVWQVRVLTLMLSCELWLSHFQLQHTFHNVSIIQCYFFWCSLTHSFLHSTNTLWGAYCVPWLVFVVLTVNKTDTVSPLVELTSLLG